MIEIRNLTFQPLTFHLAGDAGGIHLNSREEKTIGDDQLSDEIRTAAERGFVSIADVSKRTQPDPLVETTVGEHSSEPVESQQRQKKRRTR
ncbi:MAG: hypothetical protein ACYC64_10450 [Armatimonadota bacterium]